MTNNKIHEIRKTKIPCTVMHLVSQVFFLRKTSIIILFLFVYMALSLEKSLGAESLTITGRVINSMDKKPVDFATIVVMEARIKAYSDNLGNFRITIPEPGQYTVRAIAAGWKIFERKMFLDNKPLQIILDPARVTGQTLVIQGERDIQKVSRHTLTVKQLKETPATLGDPLNALTTLPGINRSFGLFGFIVVRAMTGTYGISNAFEIDGMPLLYPQHFSGIHAVVSLDLIQEIDLYASAFPAQFGNTYSAVFNFNTKDDIKEIGGYASINLISANFEVHAPIDKSGGYVMAAGRAGYLSVLVPVITKALGNEVTQLPDYFDYQLKVKKFIDSKGHHSVSMLFLGAKDEWKFVSDADSYEDVPDYVDPYNLFWRFRIKNGFDNMGLYYTYQPSKKFFFQQILYGSYNTYIMAFDNDKLPEELKGGFDNVSKQFIYGQKNRVKWEWLERFAEIHAGSEFLFYDFDSTINSVIPASGGGDERSMDIFAPGTFKKYVSTTDLLNMGGAIFLENKFTYSDWKFVPGLRGEWLRINTNSTRGDGKIIKGSENMDPTLSPRGLLSYTFPTETTIAVAGGLYYSYVQSNMFWMQNAPEITEAYYVLPEKAIHRVLSVEQKWGVNTIRAEVFYNNLFDMVVVDKRDPSRVEPRFNEAIVTRNSGHGENKGFEIMLRRDKEEKSDGIYGWVSYTFTDARFNLALPQLNFTKDELVAQGLISPTKIVGATVTPKTEAELIAETTAYNQADDQWFRNNYESRHSFKLTGGYVLGNHNFSIRYEFATSRPYTPISGNSDPTDYQKKGVTKQRYAPIYGERNSERYEPSHRVDLRYAYKSNYSWGYISFYVEVIMITNNVKRQRWNYSQPYQEGANPSLATSDDRIPFIPLIGAEVKF